MKWLNNIEWANPEFFWLLLIIPLIIGWYILRRNRWKGEIPFSQTSNFPQKQFNWYNILVHIPFALRLIALSAIIVALARPQSSLSWQDVTTEGIDIVIALDVSGSMLAEDFSPNRLEASKEVAMEFISERPSDRIGLVVYGGESFTQCPLTTDHDVIINLFKGIKHGIIEDGTAIGMGLATAVNRLRESDAKSRVVILLTDGENNKGSIPPITAAEIAREFGVRVYTIGVGTIGEAPYPVQTMFGIKRQMQEVRIDEKTLQEIASMTDGKYFRATDNKKLAQIYQEIDQMEKAKIQVTEYKKKSEEFFPFAIIASLVLVFEFLFSKLILKGVL